MRLALAKADFIRTQILSKKISTKFFKEENTDVCTHSLALDPSSYELPCSSLVDRLEMLTCVSICLLLGIGAQTCVLQVHVVDR